VGEAVVLSGAPRVLASQAELSKKYHWCSHGQAVKYTHKTTGAVLMFRKENIRFGDPYFHALFTEDGGYTVSALDFYNPAPLSPVLPKDEDERVWPLIRDVERLHEEHDQKEAKMFSMLYH
jgi:hypothetical protein